MGRDERRSSPRLAAYLGGTQIVGAVMGVVHQLSIDETGSLVTKQHTTHDQSFNPVPGTAQSLNDRCPMSALTPGIFVRAQLRYITRIVSLCRLHQDEPIFLSKVDWGRLPLTSPLGAHCRSSHCGAP